MDKLVIVESPNKTTSLKKFLGKEYEVKASGGHIFLLATSGQHGFGVDVEKWIPNYKIDPKKEKQLKDLKKALKGKKEVYIATDPDREGEAIGSNLVEYLKIKDKYKRIKFNEITKEAVIKSISNHTKINQELVNSQIARRILDRIIGFKLSGLIQKKIQNSPAFASAGRVQSIALKKVAEKEEEIEKFVPIKYITVDVIIEKNIVATLFNSNFNNKIGWINPKDIDKIKKYFKGSLKVALIKKTNKKDNKKIPLKQASLYKKAFSILHISSGQTKNVSQKLYVLGLISYHRTDSTRFSLSFVNKAKSFIKESYGDKYVADEIKGSSGAQDAHEAIRPTDLNMNPEKAKIKFKLSLNESKIYDFIYYHTLEVLMKPAIREITRYEFVEANNKFKLSSSKVIFDGYLKLKGYKKDQEFEYKKDQIISIKKENYKINNLQTSPPSRYNDGSLIEILDLVGVGRPSTFASTVKILKDRLYVNVEGKALKVTEFGKIVFNKLNISFPKIINEEYTANMENNLDKVAEGEMDYKDILLNFWNLFQEELNAATQTLSLTKIPLKSAGKKCPKCGSDMVIRISKKFNSKFTGCSKFPECKYVEKEPLKLAGKKCPKCGTDLVIRTNKRNQSKFFACPKFPKCKYAESEPPKLADKKCSECGSDMMIKTRKNFNSKFIGCSNFPKCKNMESIQKKSL